MYIKGGFRSSDLYILYICFTSSSENAAAINIVKKNTTN